MSIRSSSVDGAERRIVDEGVGRHRKLVQGRRVRRVDELRDDVALHGAVDDDRNVDRLGLLVVEAGQRLLTCRRQSCRAPSTTPPCSSTPA